MANYKIVACRFQICQQKYPVRSGSSDKYEVILRMQTLKCNACLYASVADVRKKKHFFTVLRSKNRQQSDLSCCCKKSIQKIQAFANMLYPVQRVNPPLGNANFRKLIMYTMQGLFCYQFGVP